MRSLLIKPMKDNRGVICPQSARRLALGDAVAAVGVIARAIEERLEAGLIFRLRLRACEENA